MIIKIVHFFLITVLNFKDLKGLQEPLCLSEVQEIRPKRILVIANIKRFT